ncbi:MAG: hypothetical protein ACOZBL_00525 [Patescibacteria group bacterium]
MEISNVVKRYLKLNPDKNPNILNLDEDQNEINAFNFIETIEFED